ncbi:hypothetical protein BGZ49_000175, partial [Haplosporangium sp. Z 27]
IGASQDIFPGQPAPPEDQNPVEIENEFDMIDSLDGMTLGSSDEHETAALPSESNIASAATTYTPESHVSTKSDTLDPMTSSEAIEDLEVAKDHEATENPEDSSSSGVNGSKSREETPPEPEKLGLPNANPTYYNIILLGQTQSGKSTFIQAVRRYADPACEIDKDTIGNGNSSCTTEVLVHTIKTNFQNYELCRTGDYQFSDLIKYIFKPHRGPDEERKVDTGDSDGNLTPRQFKKIIKQEGLVLRKLDHSDFPTCTIRIFDTPGLEDTNGRDERNIANILSALSDSNAIHLVLIMVSRDTPLTPGLQIALENYSNIFSAMEGLMAFVHTKVKVTNQYCHDTEFANFMGERRKDLMKIMGRDIPHYLIDCDLKEERPGPLFFRQHVIRSLLLQAPFNVAVKLDRVQLHKTKRMMDIDAIIEREFKANLAEIEQDIANFEERYFSIFRSSTVETSISEQSASEESILKQGTFKRIVVEQSKVKLKLDNLQIKLRECNEYISNHDTEVLKLVHENQFSQNWSFFDLFTGKNIEFKSPKLECTIDRVDLEKVRVDVKESQGGVGYNFWSATIHRNAYCLGTFHAKVYTKSSKVKHKEISSQKTQREVCKAEIRGLKTQLEYLEREFAVELQAEKQRRLQKAEREREEKERQINLELEAGMQQLGNKQNECLNMIARAERKTLHLNLFKAITDARVYEGSTADCIAKVRAFYSKYVPAPGEEVPLEP